MSVIGLRECFVRMLQRMQSSGSAKTTALQIAIALHVLFLSGNMRRHKLVLLVVFSLLYSAKNAVGNKRPVDDRERERNQRVRYTSSWAVEITGGGSKLADAVAKRHGYRNLGKVYTF